MTAGVEQVALVERSPCERLVVPARSSGIVAWMVLAFSMLWGLALGTRILGTRSRPSWVLDLHRYLGGLAVALTAVHVGVVLVDRYVHFTLLHALVPFTGSWHPVALAWGVVSLYLLVASEVTALPRRRMSTRAWRAVHDVSFPLFVTATIHGVTVGTDRHGFLPRAALVVVAFFVAMLTTLRCSDAVVSDVERVATTATPSRARGTTSRASR